MTWSVVDDETALKLREQKGTHLILFFASGDPPWCPDCRDVDPTIRKVFDNNSSPTLNVVKVGDRPTWKDPSNKWRSEPYRVSEIPTLIQLVDGKEKKRLLQADLESEEKLRELIQ
ncbi:thioredoxin-like protein [Meira miltonrushii]|uniref:Thioredoxin-like protein n=1 Tax=Meira miltonrushii TaxID=1280837 RepID=A0A316V3V0_9BASI|nr:thioredoxin-like protein [Meira miltonrushii]PWN32210.1 thioredoxin-like protein [Meira miltonrushii]